MFDPFANNLGALLQRPLRLNLVLANGRKRWIAAGKRIARVMMICVISTMPASADEPPIYQPCLTTHANMSGYVTEMEAQGWSHLEVDSENWNAAAGTAFQTTLAMQLFSPSFESLEDVTEFTGNATAGAAHRYRRGAEVFARDGVSAVASLMALFGDELTLTCVFAAPNLPEAAVLLAENARTLDGLGVSSNRVEMPISGADGEVTLDAMRLEGTPLFTAMLSGREALMIRWSFEPPS